MGFASDFLWGASGTAYQMEGAYDADGKGAGIWDALSGGHISHGDNGNVACDHYHCYKEDVALMRQMRLKAYRFSVSWPRIMPRKDKINEKGILFYKNLVGELTDAGIVPICGLYDWNLPMWLHDEGGWEWEEISSQFEKFTEIIVEALSEQVSLWLTINEAASFIGNGYMTGKYPPFENSPPDAAQSLERLCRLTKNVLLAHGKAVRTIRAKAVLPPRIGIAADGKLFIPWEESKKEIEKARKKMFPDKADWSFVNWWLDPLVRGKVQQPLAHMISREEAGLICQPLDFIGYNCYKANNYDDGEERSDAAYPGFPRTATDWPITPEALYWAVRFCQERYALPVLIAENGMANVDFKMQGDMVHDQQRIQYLKEYLKGLKRAVNEGYQVSGYLYGSLFDKFEWTKGYSKRFGLVYVDYRTQERIPKDSAMWFAQVIHTNGENL